MVRIKVPLIMEFFVEDVIEQPHMVLSYHYMGRKINHDKIRIGVDRKWLEFIWIMLLPPRFCQR